MAVGSRAAIEICVLAQFKIIQTTNHRKLSICRKQFAERVVDDAASLAVEFLLAEDHSFNWDVGLRLLL